MSDAFAFLLRRHRLQRRLTQEQLAERAEISARSLRELERGRSPRPDTAARLGVALDLPDDERAEFVATARQLYWAGRRDRPAPAGRPASGPDFNQLPPDLPDFIGRVTELAVLNKELEATSPAVEYRPVNVCGPPGVGKTALTIHAAHRHAAGYPDGVLFARLRGNSGDPADPAAILADLLHALGVDRAALPAGVDARAAMFRSRIARRRVLLVLDDAAGHHQVEPLLPGTGVVLVSSRIPLTGLPGVSFIDLDPLPTPDAMDLLGRVAGENRVDAEPAAAAELVAACGRLPLAVRIAAARLAARPQWTVSGLMARFADERQRLDELSYGDLTVRSGLELAHRALSQPAAKAFALLGGLDLASVPEWSLAVVLDTDRVAAAAALDELVDARLLEYLGPDPAGQVRYGFHDLTRLYARERAATLVPDEPADTLRRAAAAWLTLLRRAQEQLECERLYLDEGSEIPVSGGVVAAVDGVPAADRPLAWFAAERTTLSALVTACVHAGAVAHAWALAGCAADFYNLTAHYDDWHRVTRAALDACRKIGDRVGEAAMLRSLGGCLVELDDVDLALTTLQQAHDLAMSLGDRVGAAMTVKDSALLLALVGRLDEAERAAQTVVTELVGGNRHTTRTMALVTLGLVQRQRGQYDRAIQTYQAAVSGADSRGDRFGLAMAYRGLSGALREAGYSRAAESAGRQAAELFTRLGDQIGLAQSLRAVGEALAHDPGRRRVAERALADAAAIFDDAGYEWGAALTELSLGELTVRHGGSGAAAGLHRSLRFWLAVKIPALQARTLVALADAAELDGDPAAPGLLRAAHRLYVELDVPEAAALAERLGPLSEGPVPDLGSL